MKYWKVILDNDKQAIMIPEKIIIQEEENLYINSIQEEVRKQQEEYDMYIQQVEEEYYLSDSDYD